MREGKVSFKDLLLELPRKEESHMVTFFHQLARTPDPDIKPIQWKSQLHVALLEGIFLQRSLFLLHQTCWQYWLLPGRINIKELSITDLLDECRSRFPEQYWEPSLANLPGSCLTVTSRGILVPHPALLTFLTEEAFHADKILHLNQLDSSTRICYLNFALELDHLMFFFNQRSSVCVVHSWWDLDLFHDLYTLKHALPRPSLVDFNLFPGNGVADPFLACLRNADPEP